MAYNDIYTRRLFNAESISASASSTSSAIDLGSYAHDGYFSIQLTVSGSGTVKLEYQLSNDGVTYKEPSNVPDITSTFGATSGPDSDGKDVLTFRPALSRWLKIKATEDGGAAAAVVTAWIAIS